MVILVFDHLAKQIEVASPGTTLDVQELYNKCKTEEAFPNIAMTQGVIITAAGKEQLGGGVTVGITATMRNGWKVGFEARGSPTAVEVLGGNLVAESGIVGDQFFQTTNVQIQYQSSSSATIAGAQTTENNQQAIENQNVSQGAGDVFYVDPLNGDDTETGTSILTAVQTVAQAMTLVTSGNDDVVYIRSTSAAHIIVTENITIAKNNVHLRGLGRHIKFQPTSGVPITVSGRHCEVSGIEFDFINHTGASFGIDLMSTATDTTIQKCHFIGSTDVSINVIDAIEAKIVDCNIQGSQGVAGIFLQNSDDSIVTDTIVYGSLSDGVRVTGTSLTQHVILDNVSAYDNNGYGLNILNSNVQDTVIRPNCHFTKKLTGAGRLKDLGVRTVDAELFTRIDQTHDTAELISSDVKSLTSDSGDMLDEIELLKEEISDLQTVTDNLIVKTDGLIVTNNALVVTTDALTASEIIAKKYNENRQEVLNNQLIIYEADGVTIFKAFNLFDSAGAPTETAPADKVPI